MLQNYCDSCYLKTSISKVIIVYKMGQDTLFEIDVDCCNPPRTSPHQTISILKSTKSKKLGSIGGGIK